MALTQTFLCLECGTKVDAPEGKHGFLRCSQGHRVQVLKSRPVWQIGLFAFGIAFWILAVFIHLFQTVWLTDRSPLIVWFLLAVVGASSVYLAIRGTHLMKTPPPIGAMGRQYVTVAIRRIVPVTLLRTLAPIHIPY